MVIPWLGAFVAFLVLLPVLCMSSEDGYTRCQSAVLLTLPWGDSEAWGWGVAIAAAIATFRLLRWALQPRRTAE